MTGTQAGLALAEATARVQLRDYQRANIDEVIRLWQREGFRRQLGVAATGLGKALADGEPVLTPTGWQAIGTLRPGATVYGADGQPTEVLGVFPQGEKRIWRVTFSDGPEVRCTADHLWTVQTKSDRHRQRPWRTFTLAELMESNQKWWTPIAAPVQHPVVDLPVDPYLLGVLLGDGCLTIGTPHFTTADAEMVNEIAVRVPFGVHVDAVGGSAYDYRLTGRRKNTPNPLTVALRDLGVMGHGAHDKFIPDLYRFAHEHARWELLRGLLDTDGHVRPGDHHIEFTTVSDRLAQEVARLARSLGAICRVHRHATSWRLSFAFGPGTRPFRLTRKAEVHRDRTKYQPQRAIVGIEPVGVDSATCIAVAAADGLFITRGYVVTHNTIMFGSLAAELQARTLILAHRDELVNQARDKVLKCWPDATVGVVKAQRDEFTAPVVCASVQTVAGKARLQRLASRPFDVVVVDEAHHAVAATYRRVLAAVGCGPDSEPWHGHELGWERPLLLGVTATPDRGDRVALRSVFDKIAFSQDMLWGIRSGYLTDLRSFRVVLDFDLDELKVRGGDYVDTDAAEALVAAGAPLAAVDAWRAHAAGRKALIFTPTVDSARLFAKAFEQEGIPAGCVSGDTPIDERRRVLDDFAAGRVTVLSNCAVLTEGYDEPSVGCVIMARPTKSRALYTQMLGRGVRLHPGKADCVAIDLVGVTGEHSLVTVPDLFGLPLSALRAGAASVAQVYDEADANEAARLARVGKIRSEVVDVWAQRRARANFAWVETMGGRAWVLNVGNGFVALEPDGAPDTWRAVVKEQGSGFRRLIDGVDLAMAQGAAEDYVRRVAFALVKKDLAWRRGRPAPKQAAAVKAWGGDPDGMTAGEASDFLTARIAAKDLRRSRR